MKVAGSLNHIIRTYEYETTLYHRWLLDNAGSSGEERFDSADARFHELHLKPVVVGKLLNTEIPSCNAYSYEC